MRHITAEHVENSGVHLSETHAHLHAKSGTVGSGHPAVDPHYYHVSVEALKRAQDILIVGLARAKPTVIKHIHSQDPAMMERIVGVKMVDHPAQARMFCTSKSVMVALDSSKRWAKMRAILR
jgi:hypothetical protein